MKVEELKGWGERNMKPFFQLALAVMPKSTFAGYLIGYAVSIGRSGGMTDEQLQQCLAEALGAAKTD